MAASALTAAAPVALLPLPPAPAAPALPTLAAQSAEPPADSSAERRMASFGDLHLNLLEQFAPPSLVVNAQYNIVHLSEHAARFLQIAGEPSLNLMQVAHPALRIELRTALFRAAHQNVAVTTGPLLLNTKTGPSLITLHVRPTRGTEAERFYLVVFDPVRETDGGPGAVPSASETIVPASETITRHLEDEIEHLREQMRATVEQYEASVEELKAANEEHQSINEEMRSTAEELETSKEELQSTNEELTTVNQELKSHMEELSRANGENGALRGFVKVCRDLTERKRAEEERLALEHETTLLTERNRMAQELHDTLAQGFTGIKMQLEMAQTALEATPETEDGLQRVARAKEIALSSHLEARRAIRALRSPLLEDATLPEAFQRLVNEISDRGEIRFVSEGTPLALPVLVENDLYRIGQEAVTNAIRHSGAQQVVLTLTYFDNQVHLSIVDNGKGFDLSTSRTGFGVTGMQERARRLGAELQLASQPGQGTHVNLIYHIPAR